MSPPAAVPKRTGGAASGSGTRQAAVVAAKATTPQPQLQLQTQQHVEGSSYWAGWANIHDRDAWQGGAAAAEWYAGRQAAETAAAAYTASQQASVNCAPAGWQSLSQAATAATEQAAASMVGAGQAAPQPMAKQGRHASAAGITQPAASVTFAAAPPWQRGAAPLHTGLDTQAAGAAGHVLTRHRLCRADRSRCRLLPLLFHTALHQAGSSRAPQLTSPAATAATGIRHQIVPGSLPSSETSSSSSKSNSSPSLRCGSCVS